MVIRCIQCGNGFSSASLTLCADCIREYPSKSNLYRLHAKYRETFELPPLVPEEGDIECRFCANKCRPSISSKGYCGVRENKGSRIERRAGKDTALAHAYLDPLPTNCCAEWFCRGSKERGYNLAVFFYGCGFDCLFCQNAEHKDVDRAPSLSIDELVEKALSPRVRCVCFFGGSPEPQMDFAIKASSIIIRESGNKKHICWEWNGSGNPRMVLKAAELSYISGGTVKFDLKAWNEKLHIALCGTDNKRTLENFKLIGEEFRDSTDLLTATTLMVSYYVDKKEVNEIAGFISSISREIPYSLLAFHPDFVLDDLPPTPKSQANECYETAKKYLRRVNIGNRYLLW